MHQDYLCSGENISLIFRLSLDLCMIYCRKKAQSEWTQVHDEVGTKEQIITEGDLQSTQITENFEHLLEWLHIKWKQSGINDLFREAQVQGWPVTREECKTCISSCEQYHVSLGRHPLENDPLHWREGKGLWEAWQVDYYSFLLTREVSFFLFLFSRKEQPTQIQSPRGSQTDTDCNLIGMRMLFLIILV